MGRAGARVRRLPKRVRAHEVSGNLRAAAAQQMIKNDDADKARMQKAARIEKRSAPCLISREILASLLMYLEDSARTHEIINACVRTGMSVTEDRTRATAIVTTTPSQIGQRSMWTAVLKVCYVLAPDVLFEKQGACIKYHQATATRRRVWLSPQFEERHASLACIIRAAVESPGSCWNMIPSKADFITAATTAIGRGRACEVPGVVASTKPKEPSR